MLMLTRRIGESIRIGDDIVIIVHKVNGLQVTMAIDAPDDVSVHRQEIYERIQKGLPRRNSVGFKVETEEGVEAE